MWVILKIKKLGSLFHFFFFFHEVSPLQTLAALQEHTEPHPRSAGLDTRD